MMPMNEQEFEELTVRFGADLGVWPTGKRQQAESFLASPKGQSLLRVQQTLDAFMRAPDPMPGDDTAFLARLMDIPQSHTGCSAAVPRGFLASLFGGLPSFGVVASQAAVYALVLAVGVVVGMQDGSGSGDADSVDLSAQLFASNADFYLEDE
ncbi:hypothetical protein [Kordiimonas sp.]|uniref:hypothetical protein n=1 Tax=Kordiimonas sp. TaxID=1970157 RepID=UPI003A93E110